MVPRGHRAGEANGVLSEAPKGPSRRTDPPLLSNLRSCPDDGIVVRVSWVYLLRCADGSLCVGSTDNLELRLHRHNEGRGSAFTAQRRPVTLAYSESYAIRSDARRRKSQLKRWTTAKKAALVAGRTAELHRLARRHP
jgi:predicted GIY-YIG superfamily endonuclease